MLNRLNNIVDKYFTYQHQENIFLNRTSSSLNIINSSHQDGLNLTNPKDMISNSSVLSEMFPHLKSSDKNSNSFFSNFINMVKALYHVSKISTSSTSVFESQILDNDADNISSTLNTLKLLEFTFIFKVLFKYVFSQYSFICILNAFFLNKVSHMSERNTHHRRTTIRLQLTRQQLISRRDEIARTLNDGNAPAPDVLENELLMIVGQLQEVDEQLVRQQLVEEDELEKEKNKINLYKLFGMGLHIFNILVMCYLVYFCHYKLFLLKGEVFTTTLNLYCSSVFYMVNWLECCIALNNQFNLIPHRKSILKYEGFTTFDYSLILFTAHQFFNLGNFENHETIFKFFIYNKLVYEIVTITLEIFQWKHLWLFLSTGIDLFFLTWFINIVKTGCFTSLSIIYDPILILSGLLLFLLYVPLIISYIFSIVTIFAFFVVAVAFRFKKLDTLKYYQVFKKFKTHLSSCEGSEITIETNGENSSNLKRLGTLNFNRSILQFCVFILMNEKSDQPVTQESFILKAINTLYDSEFGYINRYVTKRTNLSREFKTYPLSLNEMHLDNLISNASKKTGTMATNHKIGDRLGDTNDGFWNLLLRIDRFNQFWNFIKTFGNLKKVAQKMDYASKKEQPLVNKGNKYYTNVDDFDDDYVNILTSDISAFAVDESLDYELGEENGIDESEDDDEKDTYQGLNEELSDLLPKFDEFLISNNKNNKKDDVSLLNEQKLDFQTFVDIVKKQEVLDKLSESVSLPHFTRSYYKKYLDNNTVLDMKHELKKQHDYYSKLNSLLSSSDQAKIIEENEEEEDGEDFDDDDFTTDCVICTVNKRAIILWPCKCLAICEDCRVSLAVKKFDHCPCCRTKIKGYSKINNV